MVSKILVDYMIPEVEYALCVGKINQPVSYILNVYTTKEEAIAKKDLEEKNLIKLGYNNVLKFHVEELKILDSKTGNKLIKRSIISSSSTN